MGLGVGAGLLMPLTRQLWAAEDGLTPRRFVFVVAGNGIDATALFSPKVRQAINDAGAKLPDKGQHNFSRFYRHDRPLEIKDADFGSALALGSIRGSGGEADLTDKSALVLGLSSKVAGGGHSSSYGALSSTSATGKVPVGPTIDAWLADKESVRQSSPFDVVRLGIHPNLKQQLWYSLTALDAGKPAPAIVNPTLAYNALFGSVASAAGRAQFTDRSDLLDLAHKDVTRTLKAFVGGSEERAKLEGYLTSIEALRARQQVLLDAEATLRRVAPAPPSQNPYYTSEHPLFRLESQFDLATAALLGGLTNVAVLSAGAGDVATGLTYSSLEPIFKQDPNYRGVVSRHTVCHESGGNPAYLAVMHAVTRRLMEMTTRLARTLEAIPEGGGTMLDHTAIVVMSDNGDEHHSTAQEWPVMILGGSKLGLKTGGRAIVFPGHGNKNNRQMSNLFNTLGHAAGQPLDDFGQEGSTRIARGPLSELFG